MPLVTSFLLASFVAAKGPTAVLPLRKLRLYETGVAYVERAGGVGPKKKVVLPLRASHLDDALKSLVILESTGAVQIKGIEFGTAVSEGMARAMAGLPTETGSDLSYVDLIKSLEGSQVDVRTTGKTIRGRLLDVEGPYYPPTTAGKDGAASPANSEREPYFTLLLLDKDEAVRRVSTLDVRGIRALGRGTASRLDAAAEALSGQNARREEKLEIQVRGQGVLGVGYVSETPVWRTTYRVVLGDKGFEGQLQAWALVHNDTDEDWKNIQLELANGRPASFLHPLAAPRYQQRDLVAPQDDLYTVPQLAATTVDRMWLDTGGTAYGSGGLGMSGTGRGGGGSGSGSIGYGNVGTPGHGVGNASTFSVSGLGDLATLAKSDASESGALFLYKVANRVDLSAHHSALVPIAQEAIEVEAITWFAQGASEGRSGVRLVNTTGQTLPAGAASFFGGGGFVGEAMLDRLRAKERRFIPYGNELDLSLERRSTDLGATTQELRFSKGHVVEYKVRERRIDLTLTNASQRAQKAYVALKIPRKATLKADTRVELDFDLETNTPLASMVVPAGAQREHELSCKIGERSEHDAGSADVLREVAKHDGVTTTDHDVLAAAATMLDKASRVEQQAVRKTALVETAKADLERLRRNLIAIGAADPKGKLKDRLTKQLLGQERRIGELRGEKAKHLRAAKELRRDAKVELGKLNPSKFSQAK